VCKDPKLSRFFNPPKAVMVCTSDKSYCGSAQEGSGEADALKKAGRLRIAAEMNRWLSTK
jgi:hypothetical protein